MWACLVARERKYLLAVVTLMLVCGCAVSARGANCKPEGTVVASGKVVIFFAPSQVEYDRMTGESRDATTEALSDFLVYSKRLGMYLDSKGIAHFATSAELIEVRRVGEEPLCLARAHLGDQVGAVLSDGYNLPEVILGVVTDTEYVPLVERYFQGK
jgi:hypothetical protein